MYHAFADLAHIWDDLIDKDNPVSADLINRAFLTCLVYLPANPFYRSIQDQILPMWLTVVSAYETANFFEANKDQHGIEIAHGLRYASGNIMAYAVHVCVGAEKAKEVLPEMWKTIFYERFDEYRKEHLDVDPK
jgi:hypothetical protein